MLLFFWLKLLYQRFNDYSHFFIYSTDKKFTLFILITKEHDHTAILFITITISLSYPLDNLIHSAFYTTYFFLILKTFSFAPTVYISLPCYRHILQCCPIYSHPSYQSILSFILPHKLCYTVLPVAPCVPAPLPY